jgi:hypothetical protein
LDGRRSLRAPDLLRFFGVLGHGDRPRSPIRVSAPRELRVPLRLPIDDRVLASLAPVAVVVVQGLLVHSARRQSQGRSANVPELVPRVPALRLVARGELDLRRVGFLARNLSRPRASLFRPRPPTTSADPPRVFAARGDDWLGVLQSRFVRTSRYAPPRDVRLCCGARRHLPSSISRSTCGLPSSRRSSAPYRGSPGFWKSASGSGRARNLFRASPTRPARRFRTSPWPSFSWCPPRCSRAAHTTRSSISAFSRSKA